MLDKEQFPEYLKTQIIGRVAYWSRVMGLGVWRIDCKWNNENSRESTNCIAYVAADTMYLNATIVWYRPNVEKMDEREIDEAVRHELVHILLSPLVEDGEIERTVTLAARALKWIQDAAREEEHEE